MDCTQAVDREQEGERERERESGWGRRDQLLKHALFYAKVLNILNQTGITCSDCGFRSS